MARKKAPRSRSTARGTAEESPKRKAAIPVGEGLEEDRPEESGKDREQERGATSRAGTDVEGDRGRRPGRGTEPRR